MRLDRIGSDQCHEWILLELYRGEWNVGRRKDQLTPVGDQHSEMRLNGCDR